MLFLPNTIYIAFWKALFDNYWVTFDGVDSINTVLSSVSRTLCLWGASQTNTILQGECKPRSFYFTLLSGEINRCFWAVASCSASELTCTWAGWIKRTSSSSSSLWSSLTPWNTGGQHMGQWGHSGVMLFIPPGVTYTWSPTVFVNKTLKVHPWKQIYYFLKKISLFEIMYSNLELKHHMVNCLILSHKMILQTKYEPSFLW